LSIGKEWGGYNWYFWGQVFRGKLLAKNNYSEKPGAIKVLGKDMPDLLLTILLGRIKLYSFVGQVWKIGS
jgi:hypothetical protein